jgi:hypothetical protein
MVVEGNLIVKPLNLTFSGEPEAAAGLERSPRSV